MSLPRRTLGNTGLQVSVLGFGASPLGNVFEDVEEEAATAAVHEAFNLGINFFDTSPFYGITKSEARLGAALSSLPREELLIATKVGRYGPEEFDFSAERVRRSVQESLARLQTSYIDLVQCHDIEFGDLNQVVEETIPTLQELKKEGKVRFIGITGLPLKIYEYVLERLPPGSIDVILSYCHLTLCDRALQDIIPYLQNKQVGIINASPLAMGLLTPQGPPSWHPAPPELQAAAKAAASACTEAGVDIARLGIMHSLKCEDVATTLVGMCSVEQVRANVRHALEAVEATPAQDAALLERALEQVRSIFQPVMNVTWPSGKPENN